jgi:hypothetical protein
MITLLSAVQKFCTRTALRVPSSVVGSVDTQTQQILGLANEVLEELVDRWVFEELINETTFVTTAIENQGSIYTIAPNGFDRIIDETIYDRTQKIPIYGPVGPQAWQQAKAFVPIGPIFRYRLRGGDLLFNPTATAGHTCAFEYVSKNIVFDPVSGDYKDSFTLDTDQFFINERLLLQGLRWKWKFEKGLAYAQDKDLWETSCLNEGARSGSKVRIYQDGDYQDGIMPVIIVSPGSWPV